MNARDLFERGDTFEDAYKELTVVGFHEDGRIEAENAAGMREFVEPRKLIEVAKNE